MRRKAVVAAVVALAIAIGTMFLAPRRPARGTPEEAADSVLRDLRSGRFSAAFAQLPPAGINAETKMRERRYRLRWWWLVEKQPQSDEFKLQYHVIRGWLPVPSPVWVTVKKSAAKWRATDLEAWY